MELIMDPDGRIRSMRLDGRTVNRTCHLNQHRPCHMECMHMDLDEANSEVRFRCMAGSTFEKIVIEAKKEDGAKFGDGSIMIATDNCYGWCPRCGAPGYSREKRMNGDDRCTHGCIYPSISALTKPKE